MPIDPITGGAAVGGGWLLLKALSGGSKSSSSSEEEETLAEVIDDLDEEEINQLEGQEAQGPCPECGQSATGTIALGAIRSIAGGLALEAVCPGCGTIEIAFDKLTLA